uniref:Secreted protein n=1 Tax=Caulobacter sp. (strain K31) TaxID=366602 RepID=B0T389_CAUSK
MGRVIAGIAFTIVFVSVAAHAASDTDTSPSLDLLLRCDGVATHTATDTATINTSNDDGDTASANATTYRKERFSERVLLDLKDNGSRIRVPKSLVPPLNSGGKDGWWSLSAVNASAESITARFRLNPINKPTIRIDRSTGDIDMSGFGMTFRGTCDRQDRAERKF